MFFGKEFYYGCPSCDRIHIVGSLLSANSFGAKYYSDGKCVAPMLPEFPVLTKCCSCKSFFWLDKRTIIDNDSINQETETIMRENGWIHYAEFLSYAEYQYAILIEVYDTIQDELYIRMQLWWAFNEDIRKGKKIESNNLEKELYEVNLEKLLPLLTENSFEHLLMRSDILRYFERFSESKEVLKVLGTRYNQNVANQLILACEKKITRSLELSV